MMAAVKGKDTKPEIAVRRALHAAGFRFRLHAKSLPGRPDIVLPKHRAAIFVNGCFWHGHECDRFRWPKTRRKFWAEKIAGNRARDARNLEELSRSGWRSLTIWECALCADARAVAARVARWVRGARRRSAIPEKRQERSWN